MNIFLDILRTIFIFIDCVVYTVIGTLFRLIFNLANFELVGLYEIFERRIYVILGIFMLFKVTVSMLSYLVNPEKITDNQAGASKLITRIIVSLVMLIMLPTFFNLATEFQNKLLPAIPRIIIGTENQLSSDDVDGISKNMTLTMMQGFAHRKSFLAGDDIECDGDDELNDVWDMLDKINTECSSTNPKVYRYDYLPIISTIVAGIMAYVLFSLAISVAIRAFKLIILRMLAPIPIISYIDPKSSKDGMFSHWVKTFGQTWAELFVNIGIIYFIVFIIDYII